MAGHGPWLGSAIEMPARLAAWIDGETGLCGERDDDWELLP